MTNHVEQVGHQHAVESSQGKGGLGTVGFLDPHILKSSQLVLCNCQHFIRKIRGDDLLCIPRNHPGPISCPASEFYKVPEAALLEQSPLDCLQNRPAHNVLPISVVRAGESTPVGFNSVLSHNSLDRPERAGDTRGRPFPCIFACLFACHHCATLGALDLVAGLRDLMRHYVPAVGADAVPAWPGSFGPSHEPWPTASTATTPASSTPSLSSTHVTLLLPPPLVQLAQPTADFFELLLQQPGFLSQPTRFILFVSALLEHSLVS